MSMRPPDDSASIGSWEESSVPRWAVLDPAGEPPRTVFSTVYVADELLVDVSANDSAIGDLRALALKAGWNADELLLEDPLPEEQGSDGQERFSGASTVRLRLSVAATDPDPDGPGVVAETPDAWQLLRQARANGLSKGVSLNHILTTDSLGLNPFKANPFKANPFKANPFKANPFKANATAVGMDSYASPGFGGRQPVTYLGPTPALTGGDRPIVAIFDTGCGPHPWFDKDVILHPPKVKGQPIGLDSPATDPERHPSRGRPLEGWLDDAAGHGTFIAGIIRQECPDALILPVRIADGEGYIVENELIGALGRLRHLMQHEGLKVAVLNLSFSFYHETPGDGGALSEVATILDDIRRAGCVVVCSAGNEATDRPSLPAALAPNDTLHVSVGALNPARDSVALFSNVGGWVKTYATGVSLVSTLPDVFNGSLQAGTRDDQFGLRRETLDVDDFRGGFGVWSGTSFAAPVVAGRIAAAIAAGRSPSDAASDVVDQCDRENHSRKH